MVEAIEIHLLIHSIDRGMEENNSTSCKCNYWMYRHPRLEYLSKCILKLRVPKHVIMSLQILFLPEYSNQVWSLKTKTVGNFVVVTSCKESSEI